MQDPEASPERGAQSDEVAGVSVGGDLDKQPGEQGVGEIAVPAVEAGPEQLAPATPVEQATDPLEQGPPHGPPAEMAEVPAGRGLHELRAQRDAGVMSVSDFEAERERLASAKHVRRVTDASEEPEGGVGRRTQVLIVVGAIVVVAVLAVVAVLILRHVHQENSATPPVKPKAPHLRVPPTIAGYSAQSGTIYQTSNTLYVGYQRTTPASAFAVSAFIQKSASSAAASVSTYMKAAQQDYGSVTPITTQKRHTTTYACFTGTETQQNQTVPAAVCGWSSGVTTFTMVLAPSSDERQAAILAQFVTTGIL